MNNIYIVKVCGITYEIEEQILRNSDYFNKLLNDSSKNYLNVPIEIQRSPNIFKHVLSLMIDPKYEFPTKYLSELEFYGMKVLYKKCKLDFCFIKTSKTLKYCDIHLCSHEGCDKVREVDGSYCESHDIFN